MEKVYVYILASCKKGTLNIGITDNLAKKVYENKNRIVSGLTLSYHTNKLVYYELINDLRSALERKKRLSTWKREWKIALIEDHNPGWNDLYAELFSKKDDIIIYNKKL